MNQLQLPSTIRKLVEGKTFTIDDVGMSGNQVLIFDDMVLKIEEGLTSMDEQVQMMRWLDGKLPVPKVLVYDESKWGDVLRQLLFGTSGYFA